MNSNTFVNFLKSIKNQENSALLESLEKAFTLLEGYYPDDDYSEYNSSKWDGNGTSIIDKANDRAAHAAAEMGNHSLMLLKNSNKGIVYTVDTESHLDSVPTSKFSTELGKRTRIPTSYEEDDLGFNIS